MWTEEKEEYVKQAYGVISVRDIAETIGLSESTVWVKIRNKKWKKAGRKEWAIYKDDRYIMSGTTKECADYLGVKQGSIRYYATDAYRERTKSGLWLVDLGYWPVDEKAYHKAIKAIGKESLCI